MSASAVPRRRRLAVAVSMCSLLGVADVGTALVHATGPAPSGVALSSGPVHPAEVGVARGLGVLDVEVGPSGEVWVFALKADRTLWSQVKLPDHDWSDWTLQGRKGNWQTADVEVGPSGEVWVLGTKLDGTVYSRVKMAGQEWEPTWTRHGRAASWGIADAEIGPSGEVWVFGVKFEGTMYGHEKLPGEDWSAWTQHGRPSSWAPPFNEVEETWATPAMDVEVGPSGEVWLFGTKMKNKRTRSGSGWRLIPALYGQVKQPGEDWSAWVEIYHRSPSFTSYGEPWQSLDAAVLPTGQVWLLALNDGSDTANLFTNGDGAWPTWPNGWVNESVDAKLIPGPLGELLHLVLEPGDPGGAMRVELLPAAGSSWLQQFRDDDDWTVVDLAVGSTGEIWLVAIAVDGTMHRTSWSLSLRWVEHDLADDWAT